MSNTPGNNKPERQAPPPAKAPDPKKTTVPGDNADLTTKGGIKPS